MSVLTPVARRAAFDPDLLDTETLDTGLLRILRARLELQRDFRVDQLAALQTMAAPSDPRDRAHEQIVAALTVGAETALRETREALSRLDTGGYGRCVGCRRAQPIEQLAAVPSAAR